MPTSVRVDDKTETLLKRAAQVSGRTKSAVIREALQQFCMRVVVRNPLTPYDAIRDYLGCFEGPPDLAKASKEYLRERFRDKKNRRSG